jgi:hypothetical protein
VCRYRCPPIAACVNAPRGWSGSVCERYGSSQGYCDATASCSTSALDCYGTDIKTDVACVDGECSRAAYCQPGDAPVTSVADVCLVSAAADSCSDVACNTLYKGWNGNACERYGAKSDGFCDAAAKCSSDAAEVCPTLVDPPSVVRSCDLSCVNATACAAHTPVLKNARECLVDAPSPACPTLACDPLLFGWVANACHRYDDNVSAPGYCSSGATCESDAAARCSTLASPATRAHVSGTCDTACQRPNTCTRDSAIGGVAALSDVCFLNQTQAACADVDCSATYRGWSGATCQLRGSPSSGHCLANGACASAADCTAFSTPVALGSCFSASCIKTSECIAGQAAKPFDDAQFCIQVCSMVVLEHSI